MRHARAIELLPDLGSGELDATTEVDLIAHSERCSACRDWIVTHQLLASELSQDAARGSHPDAEVLALCVVRPEEVNEPDREEVRDHLERCAICKEHLRVMSAAVSGARPRVAGSSQTRPPVLPASKKLRIPLAAALLGPVLLGSLIFTGLVLDRVLTGEGDPPASVAPREAARAEPFEELTKRSLDGEQTIRADRRLMVSDVKISKGARVTFQADELVAFGDGFRVEAGGRMTAGSGPVSAREPAKGPPVGGGDQGSEASSDTKSGVE